VFEALVQLQEVIEVKHKLLHVTITRLSAPFSQRLEWTLQNVLGIIRNSLAAMAKNFLQEIV